MELADLNPQQRRAVEHDGSAMLVVAGAGTGKTQVITRRIAHLINQGLAKPEEILALTFTDKAAGEMLDRLDGLIGWQAYRVNALTFHAFGMQILQRYGHHLGLPYVAEVIPEASKALLIKQHLSKIKLNYYGTGSDLIEFAQTAVGYIEALQNADISLDKFRQYVESLGSASHKLDVEEARDRLALYELYESLKRQYHLIDYDDQIALPLKLLRQRPNILAKLQQQYRYVLVDEYQDTNGRQDELLRLLVPPGGNIFAVGDDDQAIYGFRGAKLSNILEFSQHFGVQKPLVLTQNYRSTQEILDAAYQMIRHNDPERLEARLGIDKRLTSQVHGQAPRFQAFADSTSEYDGVAGLVTAEIKAGQSPEQIAILAPSHRVLRAQAQILKRRGLPYRLVSNVNIFEQREVLQLWHLLRWIGLAADDETVINLLHGPFVGWDSARVRSLVDLARKQLITVEAGLERLAKDHSDAAGLIRQLAEWRSWAKDSSVGHLAYRLVFDSGLGSAWAEAAAEAPRMVQVFEDLQLWFRQMQQYEHLATDPSLAGYLDTYAQPPEIAATEAIGDENGSWLLTVHAAKGLEFDSVYIIGTTAEAWSDLVAPGRFELPGELLPKTNFGVEHERRRLMYVAMTRAKRHLLITAPVLQADGRPRRRNPLLAEIFGQVELPLPVPVKNGGITQALAGIEKYAPTTMQWTAERLPFESADGWLELSTTDIERYDRCPYEFYLERVLKISTPFGPQIAFGSLLHQLIQAYYQGRLAGEPISLEQLLDRLESSWSNRGYRSKEEAEAGRGLARSTITNFYQREEQAHRIIHASEEPFSINLEDAKLKLRGRIDLISESPAGLEIRDFKTGRRREAEKIAAAAKASLQLRSYALAQLETRGQLPAQVVLDYIVTGVEGAAQLSATIIKNHRAKLADIAEKIRQKQFAPNPDPFHNCASYRYWGSGDDDEA